MVEKIKFKNNTTRKIEVLVEPSAEYIDLMPNHTIRMEFIKVKTEFNDELSMVLENDMLIIYESRQLDMKIFVNDELKYFTTPERPRI